MTPRCQLQADYLPCGFCGEPATKIRDVDDRHPPAFFCAAHAWPIDLPLPKTWAYRRVKVVAELYFAGASPLARPAEAEAVDRIQRAIAAAGGIVSLVDVSSEIGRYVPPAPAQCATGPEGKG